MTHPILQNWNLSRIIRLGLGVFIIVDGIHSGTWLFVGLGVLFSIMPLLNIGCCTSGNCAVPQKKKNSMHTDEIIYEEIKTNK